MLTFCRPHLSRASKLLLNIYISKSKCHCNCVLWTARHTKQEWVEKFIPCGFSLVTVVTSRLAGSGLKVRSTEEFVSAVH